jgi:hypothetical protein
MKKQEEERQTDRQIEGVQIKAFLYKMEAIDMISEL